jgi:FkbM family methyltransferase
MGHHLPSMDRYRTKRWLLRPLTARRRRRARDFGPHMHAMLEAHDYRPAMLRFVEATRRQPDILVDVDLPGTAVVLDVGAYEGTWSRAVLDRAAARGAEPPRIHAFEPVPAAVTMFRRALGSAASVELHPFGLGGRDRHQTMSVSGHGSSLYVDPAAPSVLATADVELRDIDGVLTELGVERVDLVKINIEGGEYELLDRMHDTGWLARTGTLIIQFHEFAPDAYRARRRNRRQLAQTHRCTWDYPWVYERWDPRPT